MRKVQWLQLFAGLLGLRSLFILKRIFCQSAAPPGRRFYLNSELVLPTYTVVIYLFMHLVFSSYEPAQMSNWCKLIKRTKVHSFSSSADTLKLAEYGKQRITVCPFFAPSPQSVSSIVCCAHCVVNTLEMLEKVFQPLPSIVREERFCGAQASSWSQVPTCDKHHLTWNHGTGNEIRKIISNPTP